MRIHLRHYPIGQLLLAVLLLSGASLYSRSIHAATAQPPIPRGVAMKSWQDNGRNGQYVLHVVEGKAPRPGKAVNGTVTSDEECEPDAEGLSHCHNIIQLTNGNRITVIDTHNMHINRCMQPGELISVTGIDKAWVTGRVFTK